MIPLKLAIKNFLSYGEPLQTIDFSDYSLICLSGKNGNGKSALLDAMTWALWGQARKVSGNIKADGGLLHLGKTQMLVSIEFMCNGNRYQVRREFAKTYGKPYAALDFELFDEKADAFISLTDKTIRQTQEKIEKTLGIDFDTFTNSAFLRQGLSNEFSKKSPKERKQILGSILSLSRYDKLHQLALERVRGYQQEQKLFGALQEQADKELAREPEIQESCVAEKKALVVLEKKLEQHAQKQEACVQKKQKIIEQKNTLVVFEKQREALAKTKARQQDVLRDVLRAWKQVHEQTLKSPDVHKLEQERAKLLEHDTKLREQQQALLNVQGKVLRVQEQYQNACNACRQKYEQALNAQRVAVEKKAFMCKQVSDQITFKQKTMREFEKELKMNEKELGLLKKKLEKRKICEKESVTLKLQFEKRRVFYQNLVQQGNRARSELHELAHKKHTIHEQESPCCPLCEQVVTLKRKQFLLKGMVKQEVWHMHRLNRLTLLIKNLKELLLEQHKTVEKQTFELDQFKHAQITYDELIKKNERMQTEVAKISIECDVLRMQEKKELKEHQVRVRELQIQEKDLDVRIAQDKHVQTIGKQLVTFQKEKQKQTYDVKAHAQIQKKLNEIQQEVSQFAQLKREEGKQDGRKESISRLCIELKELCAQQCLLIKKLAALEPLQKKLRTFEREHNALKEEQTTLSKEKEIVLQRQARLESELQRLETVKKEVGDRTKKRKEIETEVAEYQTLAQAFGKDGIQALLIEEAIPEIEEEANKLLSHLTGNQAQIFIESLRDLKKGGVKESLDIHISDVAGVRPYELFSGGEAFRIDFALRIAISKLLARRAGTALQTLIIDEGFGSQDDEGLKRLMDAIYAIQNDFEKIIVVSHLPALKDSFPVHFVVQKTATGSVVQVEERG